MGSAKFDSVFNKNNFALKEEIRKKAAGRKIIVWKMHFPKKVNVEGKAKQVTPYLAEYLSFADNIEQYCDFFFVVLPHPLMLHGVLSVGQTKGDDTLTPQCRELLKVLNQQSNVYVDTDDDYRSSLFNADAIIIDRSTVMIEAAIVNVPTLFMRNADFNEPFSKSVQHVVNSFCQGTTVEDMRSFVESLRIGKDENRILRERAVAENFPFCDGKVAERIATDIVDGLNEKQRTIPNVVLYSAGEVCKYYLQECEKFRSGLFNIVAIVDSDPNKQGKNFLGYPVVSPNEIVTSLQYDAIVIMTEGYYNEIKKDLVYGYFLDERRIWRYHEFVAALYD